MISPIEEALRSAIRRLAGKDGFSVDVSLRESPIDKLQSLLVALNPLEAFDEEARRKAESIRGELSRRQGESSL